LIASQAHQCVGRWGSCGAMSNADCRRLEDWVAEAVTVEYLNQANAAGIRAQAKLDKEAYERRHRCDGWTGHISCAAGAVADVAKTGAEVGVNFVGGAATWPKAAWLNAAREGFPICAFAG